MTYRFINIILSTLILLSLYTIPLTWATEDGSKPKPLYGFVEETAASSPESPGIVGMDLSIHSKRYPVVEQVFKGTPADRENILPGDTVIAVDGISLLGKSLQQVDELIPDTPGTPVQFTLLRNDRVVQIEITVAALDQFSTNLQAIYAPFLKNPLK